MHSPSAPTASPARRPLFRLGEEECRSLDGLLEAEWLETDGRGAFAASTAAGCPARRYHGWLVARPEGRAGRYVLLARCEELVVRDGRADPVSTARYPGTYSPEGYRAIASFELAPWPRTVFSVAGGTLTRELLMVRGRPGDGPTTLVRYGFEGPEPVELELRPLLACRESDALTEENETLDPRVELLGDGLRVRPYEALPAVELRAGGGELRFEGEPLWYRNLQYAMDLRRGYESGEDQWSPGVLRLTLEPGEPVVLAAAAGGSSGDPRAVFEGEAEARIAVLEGAAPGLRGRLGLGATDYLYRSVRRRPGRPPRERLGVAAGYPWFGEWGRDTFIALPGLTLARGELFACGEVLDGALEYLDDGLLPNIFGTRAEDSQYGSADAALWFARAVQLYDRAGAPRARIHADFRPALERLADACLAGSGAQARIDEGGLPVCGGPDLNATWMDARTREGPVTSRHGTPVEIAALWVQLVELLEELAERCGDQPAMRRWARLRRTAAATFLERFWMPDEARLADVWRPEGRDERVRPNMVIAASLELSPLSRAQRAGVVERARRELLTPRGLRTLSPEDADYCGRYSGGPEERDRAYHQGTAWPFLLGFYAEAVVRAHGPRSPEADELVPLWRGFAPELDRAGLGHVSEVFDGDAPHQPGGTFAQAWNTGELLRWADLLERGVS